MINKPIKFRKIDNCENNPNEEEEIAPYNDDESYDHTQYQEYKDLEKEYNKEEDPYDEHIDDVYRDEYIHDQQDPVDYDEINYIKQIQEEVCKFNKI
jgi:hypothetical protein